MAAAAGVDGGVDDAIAFLDRLAEGISADAGADLVHEAGTFVADGAAGWLRLAVAGELVVAAPRVQVGAADAGLSDLEDDGPGLGIGHIELVDLERLLRPGE